MTPVYLSRPVKQFSGSRQPLLELAQEGLEALLASGGPPPGLLLLASAHPLELAGISGPDLAAALAGRAGLFGLKTRVEFYANPGLEEPTAHLAASAAGAALVHEAARRVARGEETSIAVLGLEQMRLTDRETTTQALRSLIHPAERACGLTMPALGALLMRQMETRHPGLPEALTALTVANRGRTVVNPRAHIRKALRVEDILGEKNPPVSEPLRLFDVAPTSTGYAGLFLTAAAPPHPIQVQVAGIGRGLDCLSVCRRGIEFRATREAMAELLNHLGWEPRDIRRQVRTAEIHDAFPIIEFMGLIDCGLLEAGSAVDEILAGAVAPTGALPVNATGGVMGGHPIAATGVGQIVELYLEATGRSEGGVSLGPDGGYALAFNVGGPLTYNGVTLLSAFRREDGPPRDYALSQRPHAVAADLDRSLAPPPAPGPARLVAATALQFPPPGFDTPCAIGVVETAGHLHFVPCVNGLAGHLPRHGNTMVELIRTNGHLSADAPLAH